MSLSMILDIYSLVEFYPNNYFIILVIEYVNVLIIWPKYEKILWIQNQANNRQIIGNDTFQELIVEDIVRTFFGSASRTIQ